MHSKKASAKTFWFLRYQIILSILLIAILSLTLAACGADEAPQASSGATATPVAQPATTTSPTTMAATTSVVTTPSASTTTTSSLPTVTPQPATTAAPTTAVITTEAATSPAATTEADTAQATSAAAATTVIGAPKPNPGLLTPQPTTAPASSAPSGSLGNVVYIKPDGLYAYNVGTTRNFQLAPGQILRYVVSADNRHVAFLAVNGDKLELREVVMHLDAASDPKTLDSNVGPYTASTQDNPFAGRYMQAYSLDFSPDGNLIAYSKMNPSGPAFEEWATAVHPVELWLADAQSYEVQRLAANADKDFMYKVAFSPDGQRVGFLRTANFPSDVSGTVALWSVHTDGTKLTILQDGGALSKQVNPGTTGDLTVGLISSFNWVSPMAITFFVSDIRGGTAWVHDLSNAKARQLFSLDFSKNDPQTAQDYRYDPLSHLYAFNNYKGLFITSADNAQVRPVQETARPVSLLNFYDSNLIYQTDPNSVSVQSVNQNGSKAGSTLGLSALHNSSGRTFGVLPANGDWLVVSTPASSGQVQLSVVSGDGKAMLGQPVNIAGSLEDVRRLAPDYYLVAQSDDHHALLDLSDASNPKVINL